MKITVYVKEYKSSDGFWYPSNHLLLHLWEKSARKQYQIPVDTTTQRITAVPLKLW